MRVVISKISSFFVLSAFALPIAAFADLPLNNSYTLLNEEASLKLLRDSDPLAQNHVLEIKNGAGEIQKYRITRLQTEVVDSGEIVAPFGVVHMPGHVPVPEVKETLTWQQFLDRTSIDSLKVSGATRIGEEAHRVAERTARIAKLEKLEKLEKESEDPASLLDSDDEEDSNKEFPEVLEFFSVIQEIPSDDADLYIRLRVHVELVSSNKSNP